MPIYFRTLLLLLWCGVICAVANDTPFKRHTLSKIRKPSVQSKMLSTDSISTLAKTTTHRSVKGIWMPPRVKVFHETLKDDTKYCNYDKYDYDKSVPNLRGGEESCKKVTIMDYWGGNYVYKRKLNHLTQVAIPRLASDLKAHTLVKQLPMNAVPIEMNITRICPEFVIPSEHITKGVADADIVIHVSASPFPKGFPSKRVWAYTCRAGNDQPIVLAVNYNPEYILHSGIEEYSFKEVQKALHIHPCTDGGKSLLWTSGKLNEMHFHGKCVKVGCEHDDEDEEKDVKYMKDNTWTQCVTEEMKNKYYDPYLFPCPQLSEFCYRGKRGW